MKKCNTTQTRYTYNAEAVATAGTPAMRYNAFGQRSIQTITRGGTHLIFGEDGALLAEYSMTGALARNYLYLNGWPLALVDGAGTVSYILTDQVGQPQKMLNASGAVSWHRVAGMFGDTVSQPVGATAANPMRFPGQQFDPLSALHYNYFRDYDPATGRYLETDPIGLEGGVNLYAYVDGNPVNYTDPTGEFIVSIIVGGLIGGGIDVGAQLYRNGGRFRCVRWGEAGKAALTGAALSGLGPTGSILGKGGARAAQYGYSRTAGLLNRAATRFGWGTREEASGGVSDVLRLVRNGKKTDVLEQQFRPPVLVPCATVQWQELRVVAASARAAEVTAVNVTDADVRHGAGDFRSALQELVQEQVYSNVDFVEVAEPQTDPTEDDYVVAYEASFTPRDLVHAYLKIIITNEGHVGIGLETRMRLAERVGARLWTAKETFAAGRELASITPSELISFVRLVAQGRVMLQVSFGFGLIGFGATRAVVSPEDFQSLGSQRPRSWDWLRVLTKEQSDASRRTIVRYEPW